jgi:hypothetical protein
MTEQNNVDLLRQLDAIRSELAALKEEMRHMKRQLTLTDRETPAPIWNEQDRQAVIEFWRKSGRWSGLSDASRKVLLRQLFGESDVTDEVLARRK